MALIGPWEIAFIAILLAIWIAPRLAKMDQPTIRSALATVAFILLSMLAYYFQTHG